MNCRICGAELPEGAMFCGECGSSTSATPESRRKPDPRPGDTTIVERLPRRHSGVISIPVGAFQAPDGRLSDPAASEAEWDASASNAPERARAGDAGGSDGAVAEASGTAPAPVAESAAPTPPGPETIGEDAPVVPGATGGSERFRLRFSSGETRIVFGSGLIGRKPLPQPGERFDHLVQIADRTLSVSKTHLEFGSHEGVLWISDRFSGNGTVVRRPDDGALRCEPGRRYLVPRGSTVEIAQQSFAVD
ncbi:hypothetical protein ACWKWP_12580 [Agromyces soli]